MMANIGPRWRSDRGEKGGFGLRKRRPSVGGNGTVRRPCHNGGEKGGFELRKRRPSVGGHGTVRRPCHNGGRPCHNGVPDGDGTRSSIESAKPNCHSPDVDSDHPIAVSSHQFNAL